MSNSCGPTDGPATAIVITDHDPGRCVEGAPRPWLQIEVWGGSRTGTVTLPADGDAQRCPAEGDCVMATSGSFAWGDATHPANYTVTFPDGTTESGTLTLTTCSFQMMCG
jgi:hypothetical protein